MEFITSRKVNGREKQKSFGLHVHMPDWKVQRNRSTHTCINWRKTETRERAVNRLLSKFSERRGGRKEQSEREEERNEQHIGNVRWRTNWLDCIVLVQLVSFLLVRFSFLWEFVDAFTRWTAIETKISVKISISGSAQCRSDEWWLPSVICRRCPWWCLSLLLTDWKQIQLRHALIYIKTLSIHKMCGIWRANGQGKYYHRLLIADQQFFFTHRICFLLISIRLVTIGFLHIQITQPSIEVKQNGTEYPMIGPDSTQMSLDRSLLKAFQWNKSVARRHWSIEIKIRGLSSRTMNGNRCVIR